MPTCSTLFQPRLVKGNHVMKKIFIQNAIQIKGTSGKISNAMEQSFTLGSLNAEPIGRVHCQFHVFQLPQ